MSRTVALAVKILGGAFIVFMWFYAYVLAPRESANNIDDRDWSARSEATCARAAEYRTGLADMSRIDPGDASALRKKADIIDLATDSVVQVLDSIAADTPSTAKGRELVPEWIKDFRVYVEDRRDYTSRMRAGNLVEFSESIVEGIPITERLGKFARENFMPACQPPRDLQS
ncbi:MAG: hypothetical protein RLZZ526_14 [Actinomycetota bacterium]|jgi:hypothetical protein